MKTKLITIRTSEKFKSDVQKLALNESKSVSEYITDLIKKELIKEELKK